MSSQGLEVLGVLGLFAAQTPYLADKDWQADEAALVTRLRTLNGVK